MILRWKHPFFPIHGAVETAENLSPGELKEASIRLGEAVMEEVKKYAGSNNVRWHRRVK